MLLATFDLSSNLLNCVYFGPKTIEEWARKHKHDTSAKPDETDQEKQAAADLLFEKLIRFYLLAERLQDCETANLIIGKIIRISYDAKLLPTQAPISFAYESLAEGNRLRKLLRDLWIYGSTSAGTDSEDLRNEGFSSKFLQDIAVEMLKIVGENPRDFDQTVEDICSDDPCRYHQHDERHPKCVPKDLGM